MDARQGAFCWVELATTDLPSSKIFYSSLFGWVDSDLLLDGVPYSILTASDREVGGMTALGKEAKKHGQPSYWFSYVSVADAAALAAKATDLGGQVLVGPLEMGPASIAVLKDPTGATFGLWQSLDDEGTFDDGQADAVRLNELATPDLARAAHFYSSLFGWRELDSGSAGAGYKTFLRGDEIVAGMLQSKGPAPAAWTVYFSVADAARVIEKATVLGGSALVPLNEVPDVGRLAVLADPRGAVFAVIERTGGVVEQAKDVPETTARVRTGS